MKSITFYFILLFLTLPLWAKETYTVSGGIGNNPFRYSEDVGGGVEAVYLLNTLDGATISFTPKSSSATVRFYRYEKSLADKVEILEPDLSVDDGIYTVSKLKDSHAYLVEEGTGLKAAIWIVDYSIHKPILSSIEATDGGNPKDGVKQLIYKSDELYYYANNGGQRNIGREYTIEYNTLKWDEKAKKFVPLFVDNIKSSDIGTEITVDAPLRNTVFTIRGDQFAEHFEMPVSAVSSVYEATMVKAHIVAEQENRDSPNEGGETPEGELGGSAPVNINFYGFANEENVSEPTNYYTWFIFDKKDSKNAIARYTDRNISYEFDRSGNYLVMLEVADRNSISVDTASVSFNVTDFFMDIPNYFSPGGTPGSNDEFRVAYKSIISFKCTIFNRWGTKIYQWTDPSKGWDGRYRGSLVSPGVYFCVVEAVGADGKKHVRKRDINILRSK